MAQRIDALNEAGNPDPGREQRENERLAKVWGHTDANRRAYDRLIGLWEKFSPGMGHDFYTRWGGAGVTAWFEADRPDLVHASLEVSETLAALFRSSSFKLCRSDMLKRGGKQHGAFPPLHRAVDTQGDEKLRRRNYEARRKGGSALLAAERHLAPLLIAGGGAGSLLAALRDASLAAGNRSTGGELAFVRSVYAAAASEDRSSLITKTTVMLLAASRGIVSADDEDLELWKKRLQRVKKEHLSGDKPAQV